MQDSLASVDDLAALMRTTFQDGSDARAQAEILLRLASDWARGIAHRMWMVPDDIPELKRGTVVGIILAAVRRDLTNPRRVTYEVHGPDSAAYNVEACPAGFFTAEEVRFLQGCRRTGNAWIQKTYRDDPEVTAGYLYATRTGRPIPMFAPYDTEGWQNSYRS